MKEANHENGELMLNGISVDDGLRELLEAYVVQNEHTDSDKAPDHPVIERQRRISKNTSGLEDVVKGVLGEGIKASKDQAEAIAKNLAYELAQTEGFAGKPEDVSDEQVRKYLTQASNALGNPTIGNKTELVENIMNLAAAKPGDPLYDANSALAQLISYIAAQKDGESRRLTYLRQLFAEKWARPGDGIELQHRFSDKLRVPLGPTATANNAFTELDRRAALRAQLYAQEQGPKTYLAENDVANGAHANGGH